MTTAGPSQPDDEAPVSATDLEHLISSPRFSTYLRAAADADEAVRLYLWNARISGAFAELLQHVEVIVRNAMHVALTAHHDSISGRAAGAQWFDGPSWVRHHWFNQPAQTSIDNAVRFAKHTPLHPRPDKVVSELGFGFWRYLVSDRYEQSLWVPALDLAFGAPGAAVRERRRAVEDRLAPLHLLRNRIAHCEPIFAPSTYRRRRVAPTPKRLEDLHGDALDLISWVSPPAVAWISNEVDQVAGLLAKRP